MDVLATPTYKANMDEHEGIDSTTVSRGPAHPLTLMGGSSRQDINKDMGTFSDTPDHVDLSGVFRTCHPRAVDHTFFSSAHGTFSRTYQLGHKTSHDKFKKNEIRASVFSDHNGIKNIN